MKSLYERPNQQKHINEELTTNQSMISNQSNHSGKIKSSIFFLFYRDLFNNQIFWKWNPSWRLQLNHSGYPKDVFCFEWIENKSKKVYVISENHDLILEREKWRLLDLPNEWMDEENLGNQSKKRFLLDFNTDGPVLAILENTGKIYYRKLYKEKRMDPFFSDSFDQMNNDMMMMDDYWPKKTNPKSIYVLEFLIEKKTWKKRFYSLPCLWIRSGYDLYLPVFRDSSKFFPVNNLEKIGKIIDRKNNQTISVKTEKIFSYQGYHPTLWAISYRGLWMHYQKSLNSEIRYYNQIYNILNITEFSGTAHIYYFREGRLYFADPMAGRDFLIPIEVSKNDIIEDLSVSSSTISLLIKQSIGNQYIIHTKLIDYEILGKNPIFNLQPTKELVRSEKWKKHPFSFVVHKADSLQIECLGDGNDSFRLLIRINQKDWYMKKITDLHWQRKN